MALVDHNPKMNFARLLSKVQPTDSELAKAGSFTASCKTRLAKSFNLRKFQRIGSHARGTAIKLRSDLDFLAVLSRNEAKWAGRIVNSNTFINRVSEDLNSRYVQTIVRKDQQAIVLNFGKGHNSMDVVPGFFKEFKNGKPVYFIADGSGGWLETSPEAHNSYIRKENIQSGEKLRKVGQLIRYWKYTRVTPIPISSFYIDLLLASSGICVGVKSYPYLMYEFLKLMSDRACRGLRDPLEIAGVVYAVQTTHQAEALVSSIENSLNHATKAIIAENNRNLVEANNQWSIVFNHGYI